MTSTGRPTITPLDHAAILAVAKLCVGVPLADVEPHISPATIADPLLKRALVAGLDARGSGADVQETVNAALKGQPGNKRVLKAINDADPAEAFVSSALREGVPEETNGLVFHSAKEVAEETPEAPDWVVSLYVARGNITELDGPPKRSGKTTLINEIIAACTTGRSFLGGTALKTGVVVLTEQKRTAVRAGLARAGLTEREDVLFVYWHECKRAGISFPDAMRLATAECLRRGWVLLVIDTIGRWAGVSGDSENHSGTAMEAMEPIHEAAGEDLAVIMSRHDRKSGGEVGESGRGSNAWTGEVDIVLQLARPEGNAPETQRVLSALSRFDETPDRVVIDLTDEGYISLGDVRQAVSVSVRKTILEHLPKAVTDPATQAWKYEQIAEVLPTDTRGKRPARATVDDVLKGLTDSEHGPPPVQSMRLPGRGQPMVYWMSPSGSSL